MGDGARMTRAADPPGTMSFIVPVRDDAVRLSSCLASIGANRWDGRIEVLVADNGSRDGSAEVARAAGAVVLALPGRPVAALRNAAAARATGDLLAFVDADHVIDERWAATAADVLSHPGVAAAGAPYLPPGRATWVQRAYDRLRARRPGERDVEWLGGGNLAVSRAVFTTLGGFDESLQTCEDVDFCSRVRAAGGRVVSDDRLRSVHLGDPANLRAVLFGELWRGRDNLRVTLRGPLAPRALTSLAASAAGLLLVGAAAAGLLALPWVGPWPAAAGAAGFAGLAALRTARMTMTSGAWRTVDVAASLAVAAVYEFARALALVVRAGHRVRRELTETRP